MVADRVQQQQSREQCTNIPMGCQSLQLKKAEPPKKFLIRRRIAELEPPLPVPLHNTVVGSIGIISSIIHHKVLPLISFPLCHFPHPPPSSKMGCLWSHKHHLASPHDDVHEKSISTHATNTLHKGVSSYWDMTTTEVTDGARRRSASTNPALKPLDKVRTIFGIGRVDSVVGEEENKRVKIIMSDWILAKGQPVIMYALPKNVNFCARPVSNTRPDIETKTSTNQIAVTIKT
jgi:hypothetical protein